MVGYTDEAVKHIKKVSIPESTVSSIFGALTKIDKTKNLNIFDIIELVGDYDKKYYRIRKGKYRAVFYFDGNDIVIAMLAKREDIYKLWKQ